MRKITKILSLGLALSCLITTPVFAEDATITSTGSQSVQVTATVGSSFEVTIPKAVTLTSTESGTGTYEASIPVTVKGDIPTNQVITVDTTSDTIELTNTANTSTTETADATITKGTTEFDYNTLTGGQTATTSHGVSAELTPGTWSGTASFEITLGEPVIEYTNLLFKWEPSEGYTEYNEIYYKVSDDFMTAEELQDGVKIKNIAPNGDYIESILEAGKFGLYIYESKAALAGLAYTTVWTADTSYETGTYTYNTGTLTINDTAYAIIECGIEIYGPAE